jgi:hypothetical protein
MRRLRPGSEAEMVALFLRTELPMYFHDNSLPVAGYPGQSPGVPGRCLARGGWRAPAYAPPSGVWLAQWPERFPHLAVGELLGEPGTTDHAPQRGDLRRPDLGADPALNYLNLNGGLWHEVTGSGARHP